MSASRIAPVLPLLAACCAFAGDFKEPKPEAKGDDKAPTPELLETAKGCEAALKSTEKVLASPAKFPVLEAYGAAELLAYRARLAKEAVDHDDHYLALRVALWNARRAAHIVGEAHPLERAEWGSKVRDRLYSLTNQYLPKIGNFTKRDVLRLQTEAFLGKVRADLKELRDEIDAHLKKTPSLAKTSDYVNAEMGYLRATWRIEDALAKSQAMRDQMGDLPLRLAEYQEVFVQGEFDPTFRGEETAAAVERWASTIANWERSLPTALAFFKEVSSKTAEGEELRDYIQWFEREVARKLKAAREDAHSRWVTKVKDAQKYHNPSKAKIESDYERRYAESTLGKALPAIPSLLAFSKGYHGEVTAEHREWCTKAQEAHEQWVGGREKMTRRRRLPVTLDGAQREMEMAKKHFNDESTYRGLRITSKIERYTTETVEGKYMVTRWYQGFDVTYATKKKGKWYVSYGSLSQRLNSGSQPIGEWSWDGETVTNKEILEANIERAPTDMDLEPGEIPAKFKVGQQVEAFQGGRWYAAKIIEVRADGTFKVDYDGYDETEVVPEDRIRLP